MTSTAPARLIPSLLVSLGLISPTLTASELTDALSEGNTTGDLRLRFETVEQDNPLDDADALTLRTRLTYTSGEVGGFSTVLEMEDSRIVGGLDDYTVGPTGFNVGEYSVIADPETTELDQGFLQYKNDTVLVKAGRQVITYDNHRFIGHVGWRQDRQTFDGLSTKITPTDKLTLHYSYLTQRNRIFAEVADVDSKDHLFNGSFTTPVGKLTGYAYLLEVDNDTDNALDTYGLSFNGKVGDDALQFLYTLEVATQESENGPADFDADYIKAEAGLALPAITFKLGQEILGSDDGNYGFATPLATLHKFNGWADSFLGTPAQGLVDTYVSAGGKAGAGSWLVVYHDFEADEETATVSDLGDELDLRFTWPFTDQLSAGIKYAAYGEGDINADTDKLWIWTTLKF